MGIRGLTTYIADRSDLYLLPYKLQDTNLVIDGNNIASQLYKKCTRCDSAFGGDYDEYYKIVTDFFNLLNKCNVTPIVIFDGGYEKKKLQTVYSRNLTKLVILKNSVQNSFSKFKFFPIFMKQTFWDVMEDMGVKYAQCDFEADNEIAAIARHLKCPVLSYDSDFFLFDVLYVPFSSLQLEVVKEEGKRCYMDCLIYDVMIFLKEFEGLEKSLLPLIATLLGNDYIGSKTCAQFFNHVVMPKKKNMTFTQRKIHGVLNWLKKENVETAIVGILSHVKKKEGRIVVQAINKSIHDYTTSSKTMSLFFKTSCINSVVEMNDVDYFEGEDERLKGLPKYFLDHFHQCRILPFLMDMATLHIYFTPLQVEDMEEPSAHSSSFPIIQAIYTIISAYTNENNPLKIYLKANNRFSISYLEKEPNFFTDINILDFYEKSSELKINIIFKILNFSDEDKKIVDFFDNEWKIFIVSVIYWIKVMGRKIVTSQIQSVLFSALSNFVVQRRVGYFTSKKSFLQENGSLLNKLEKERNDPVVDEGEPDFSKLISAITRFDCLKLAQKLLPFRRTNEDSILNFSISRIHSFSVFQSLLYHLIQLNSVLDFPLSPIKICEFYSGTLIYNVFFNMKKKQNTIEQLINDLSTVRSSFNFLVDKLFCYFPTDPNKIKRKQKKKKKRLVAKENNSEASQEDEVIQNSDYEDENNPYYFLRNNVC